LGSTRIYNLLIMSDHVMDWVLVWVAGGLGSSPGPLAQSLWALEVLLVMFKSVRVVRFSFRLL